MNYGASDNPSYGYAQPAYPPGAVYAQSYVPQYPIVPYAQPYTGATHDTAAAMEAQRNAQATAQKGAVIAADPGAAKPGVFTMAFWQEPTWNIPRWALLGGAIALGTIGYGWQAGWFDGRSGTRTSSSTRSSSSRDASRGRRGKRRRAAASSAGTRRKRGSSSRSRSAGRRRGRGRDGGQQGRFDFDF